MILTLLIVTQFGHLLAAQTYWLSQQWLFVYGFMNTAMTSLTVLFIRYSVSLIASCAH